MVRNKKKKSKKPIMLIIAILLILSASAFCYLNNNTDIVNVQFTAFTGCEDIVIEGFCEDVPDCLELMPNDMPGDIRDIGDLNCMENQCIFTPNSCIEGIYEA